MHTTAYLTLNSTCHPLSCSTALVVLLILTALVHFDLINVVFHTVDIFINVTLHFLNNIDVKIGNNVIIASLKSEPKGI